MQRFIDAVQAAVEQKKLDSGARTGANASRYLRPSRETHQGQREEICCLVG